MARIVNIGYKCCGLFFDAAIDCDWVLHDYPQDTFNREATTPIELYCLDKENWDVRMIYQPNRNTQYKEERLHNHTFVDWDLVMKETRKWVREMRNKQNKM